MILLELDANTYSRKTNKVPLFPLYFSKKYVISLLTVYLSERVFSCKNSIDWISSQAITWEQLTINSTFLYQYSGVVIFTIMNNLNIESVIHHFGLDHLEIFGSFKDESLFDKLDFDNSNY